MRTHEYEAAIEKFDQSVMTAWYYLLGLTGELGEVAEPMKKSYRRTGTYHPEDYRETMIGELGDVLWYLTRMANLHQITLEDLMEFNVDKLTKRYSEGRVTG